MAVAPTNRVVNFTATGATSFSTASWTPPSNELILACFYSRTGITADPNVPTCSGNGLTWVQVATIVFDTTSSSRRRLTMFRAMGSSPSSGATTFDCGGQTQTGAIWNIDSFSSIDTGGTNGSAAVVQSATNKDETLSATTLTVTLAAFGSSSNATYGYIAATTGGNSFTVGSGFSSVSTSGTNAVEVACDTVTEFRNDNDTSVDATISASGGQLGGIAVEIKAAGGAAASVKQLAALGVG